MLCLFRATKHKSRLHEEYSNIRVCHRSSFHFCSTLIEGKRIVVKYPVKLNLSVNRPHLRQVRSNTVRRLYDTQFVRFYVCLYYQNSSQFIPVSGKRSFFGCMLFLAEQLPHPMRAFRIASCSILNFSSNVCVQHFPRRVSPFYKSITRIVQ